MNVLFVYTRELPQSPIKPLVEFDAIQFGISSISSYLKQHGHTTKLLVMTRKSNFSMIDEAVNNFNPKLICFTAVATEYLSIKKIGAYIKKSYRDIFLLVGGVHVSLRPEPAILDTFDALCIGEGEEAALEVVSQLERQALPRGIANLWINHNGEIEKNPTRCFIADLNSLPNTDRDMWMEWIDLELSSQMPSLLLGRGCPFNCTYCCNHSIKKLAAGTYVRFRSQLSVINEIRGLIDLLPKMKEIYFEVETLGANVEWGLEFCRQLQEFNATHGHRLTYGVNYRITPNMKKADELFAAMKSSNFRFINIGLESGSSRVRKEVLRRNYSNEDVAHAVSLARKNNLEVIFYNLIGLPSETIDEFKETVAMNRMCQPDMNNLSIFYPYPGTDLYDRCEEQGLLPRDIMAAGLERITAAMDFPGFNKKQIQKAFIWFDYYVYKGHRDDDVLFAQIIKKYILANGGKINLRLIFVFLRDLVSPSLKFYPEFNEYLILKFLICKIFNVFFRRTARG